MRSREEDYAGAATRTHRATSSLNGWSEPCAQVAELQRSRLLAAAVQTVEELGYSGTTVAHITGRARVSRRTFYELFSNRDECLAAVLEDVVERLEAELAAAGIGKLAWPERVRMGLWTILSFLDREPAIARVCFVQAARGGTPIVERREEIIARLATALGEGRTERGGDCTPLTAEGLIGAAVRILYSRLRSDDHEPLTNLLGELMGMIVLPYMGPAAARREQSRPAPEPSNGAVLDAVGAAHDANDPLDGLRIRLTYRTARALEGIADNPSASNRAVSEHAGITDQGQASKLLARLERIGLITNAGIGQTKWQLNAWTLTPRGRQVVHRIVRDASSPPRTHRTPQRLAI
jgi:AcrR family transcriptional regulator